jgi:hypothetical protein
VWGSEFTSKGAALQRGVDSGAQAIVCGDARYASQVLRRCAQAVSCGAARLLDRDVPTVERGAARCALHINGRGARTDAFGRSFAVLSTQVSTVGLRLG